MRSILFGLPAAFMSTYSTIFLSLVIISLITAYVSDNLDELSSNGYEIIKGKRLKNFIDEVEKLDVPDINVGNISNRTSQLAIFDFRSFLDLAMMLVDSQPAKSLRQVMLDIVSWWWH